MRGKRLSRVLFEAHVELLRSFLAHRARIVERIEAVLNAQRRPIEYLQDDSILSRHIDECFFAGLTGDPSHLRDQLEAAHRAGGFKPRHVPQLHNDLIDSTEMAIRGFHCWQQTRWPGRNGRVRYAHTLFGVYLLRWLELLSLRLWGAESSSAGDRLALLQSLLDGLSAGTPADLPVLVRDARWLIPLAQSPTTDELAAYFEVAECVAETLAEEDRIEIQKAHLRMIAGHLRSQMRHYCLKDGISIDDHSVMLRTRTSNALDFALLVQGLVPLLEAYERAGQSGDHGRRFELAGVVCQAISPDPELFLNRVDLLGAYSMIEHLFVTMDRDEQAVYTPMGERHVRLLRDYEALIGRLSKPLHEDCTRFRPVAGRYSPYGAIYGTPTNLVEDMALKTLQLDAATHLTLEDIFTDGGAEKLAWVNGWRNLPHVDPHVRKRYEYPQQFAVDVFERIEQAFGRRVADRTSSGELRTGRLFILPEGDSPRDSRASTVEELPTRYIGSSDAAIVAAQKAEAYDRTSLLHHRQEGYFAVSYETSGGWVAIKKDFLSEVLGSGRDAKIVGLPLVAAGVLQAMCPNLGVSENAL